MKKNKILMIAGILFTCTSIFSCAKQNAVENIPMKQVLQRSDEYFANLRAYKKSKHQIYFGWFGGLGNEGNSNSPGVLDQIPDSVDIVSCWGGLPPIGSYNYKKMQEIRKLKGTRFVSVMFAGGISRLMKKNTPDLVPEDRTKWKKEDVLKAIDLVAKAIADTIELYNIDGLDMDYEPGEASERNEVMGNNDPFGSDADGRITVVYFFKAMSKYLGPKSGTGKLLIIDGYNERGTAPYIDYLVQQAYYTSSPAGLQNRYMNFGFNGVLPPEKFVVTEDFEAGWRTGGVNFSDPVLGTIPSIFGFARWNPTQGKKGGIGSYHTEYEYPLNPDYKYTRQAIQMLNPAVK